MANRKGSRARFGSIRALPSGRYQARYLGPDGLTHKAHTTFDTKADAETWLATVRTDIVRDAWHPAGGASRQPATFGVYAERWLIARSLEARTRSHYRSLLDRQLLPQLKDVPLRHVTPDLVREWHATTALDTPTLRSHAYGLLRTILGQAVRDELIRPTPVTSAVAETPSGSRSSNRPPWPSLRPWSRPCRSATASWCCWRRGAGFASENWLNCARGQTLVKKPKSDAGVRDVAIPHTYCPLSANTCSRTRRRAKRDCCSLPAAGVTWHRPACTGCSTGRVRLPGGQICGFTTYATPARFWQLRRAPRSPSSWAVSDIPLPARPCAINTQPRAGTWRSPRRSPR